KTADSAPERILPRPEEPMDKETLIGATGGEVDDTVADVTLPATGVKADAPVLNLTAQESKPAAPETLEPPAAVPAKKPAEVVTAKPVAVEKPVEKKASAPAPAAASGDVYVQLGSYRDAGGADAGWAQLSKKHATELGGLKMR